MRLSVTFAALLILGGCVIVVPDGRSKYEWSSDSVRGNGTSASETREASGTTALRVETRHRSELEVEVRVGAAASLTLDGDSNLLPLVRTEVSGDTLRIWNEAELRSSGPIRIVYTTPQLRDLASTGSARVNVSGLNGGALRVAQTGSGRLSMQGRLDKLDLDHTGSGSFTGDALESRTANVSMVGSGRVDLGTVQGESLRVSTTGSGAFYARGAVRTLDVKTLGSGGVSLSELRAETASLSGAGSGGISAYVTQRVDAHGNGSGAITVSGNPAQRNVSGRHTSVQ